MNGRILYSPADEAFAHDSRALQSHIILNIAISP